MYTGCVHWLCNVKVQGCSSRLVGNGEEKKGRKPANHPVIGIGHIDSDRVGLEYYAAMKNYDVGKRCGVNEGKRRLV